MSIYSITTVIASKFENVSWVQKLNGPYNPIIYRPNEPEYHHTTKYEKGFEVCMYLRYIIDHYHNLSDYTIFLHGHEHSWHSKPITPLIKNLKYGQFEYANLNYEMYQTVNPRDHKWFFNAYDEFYGDYEPLSRPPEYINGYCCAQFAVSRNRILRHPLSFYENLDAKLQKTQLPNYRSSRVFEYMWSIIFGQSYDDQPYSGGMCTIAHCTSAQKQDSKYKFSFRNSGLNRWRRT